MCSNFHKLEKLRGLCIIAFSRYVCRVFHGIRTSKHILYGWPLKGRVSFLNIKLSALRYMLQQFLLSVDIVNIECFLLTYVILHVLFST